MILICDNQLKAISMKILLNEFLELVTLFGTNMLDYVEKI